MYFCTFSLLHPSPCSFFEGVKIGGRSGVRGNKTLPSSDEDTYTRGENRKSQCLLVNDEVVENCQDRQKRLLEFIYSPKELGGAVLFLIINGRIIKISRRRQVPNISLTLNIIQSGELLFLLEILHQ